MNIEIWDDTPQNGEARNEFRPNQGSVRFILNCTPTPNMEEYINEMDFLSNLFIEIGGKTYPIYPIDPVLPEWWSLEVFESSAQQYRINQLFTRLAHLIIAVNAAAVLSGILTAIIK